MPNNDDGYDLDKYDLGAYRDYIRPGGGESGRDSGGADKSGSNKLVPFLVVTILILIAGIAYFLGKESGPSEKISNNEKKADKVAEPKAVAKDKSSDDQNAAHVNSITAQVKNAAISTNAKGKMSQEEIAAIVQMVIAKMDKKKNETAAPAAGHATKEKNDSSRKNGEEAIKTAAIDIENIAEPESKEESEPESTGSTEDQTQNNELIASLTDTEVDSLAPVSDNVYTLSQNDKKKKAGSKAAANTYNKIAVGSDSNGQDDDLSRLSDEISSVVDSDDTRADTNSSSSVSGLANSDQKDTNGSKKGELAVAQTTASTTMDTNSSTSKIPTTGSSSSAYTQSIKKEVKTRTKEMRYIVVKKGDTLGGIARKAYGDAREYKKIFEANPDILRRADMINIGQKLRIP
jgi:nucleoid-associated protein YgaU